MPTTSATTPAVPTVHLNGTGRSALLSQYRTAIRAMDDAIDALCAAAPHGRDYYPQGPDAYRGAAAEHEGRWLRLRAVRDELEAIETAIRGAGQ